MFHNKLLISIKAIISFTHLAFWARLALVIMRVALFYIAMITIAFDTFIAIRFPGYYI